MEEALEVAVPLELARLLAGAGAGAGAVRYCRVCAREAGDTISLFSPAEECSQLSLAEMLSGFTQLQVIEGDGMPLQVCTNCKDLIVQSYSFKLQCERMDTALRAFLQGNIIYQIKTQNTGGDFEDVEYLCESDQEIDTKNMVKIEIETDLTYNKQQPDDPNKMEIESKVIKNCSTFEIKEENSLLNAKYSKKIRVYCDFCHKSFKNIKKLSVHMARHYPEKGEVCEICGKLCLSARGLNRHILSAHSNVGKVYPCAECDTKFSTERDATIHSAIHTKDKFACKECCKEFTTLHQLKRHINRHMDGKPHKCALCNKTFSEVHALHRHERRHYARPVEKKHQCTYCAKRFAESSDLKVHTRTHTGERPYVCVACGRGFASTRLLNSHMKTHLELKPYVCEVCDTSFRHLQTLKTHRRTHTGEKPYVCSACGKTFIQSSNLSLHMRTHSGERPYTCTVCNKRFNSSSSLKTHNRIHTGVKPYSCNVCGQRFARVCMKAHMRTHTGERPFKCSLCEKTFQTSYRLKEHTRIHSGVKPFECGLCGMKIATKASLVKHVTNHRIDINKSKINIIEILPVKIHSEESKEALEICQNVAGTEIVTAEQTKGNPVFTVGQTENIVLNHELDRIGPCHTNYCIVPDNVQVNDFKGNDFHLETSEELDMGASMNLMAVGEGGLSIATTNSLGMDSGDKKLYHMDQRLVHIHSDGGQLTISKITSKMTANFE